MEEIPAAKARSNISDVLNRVVYQGKHIVLTRKGRREAVLVPIDWYEHMTGKEIK